MAKPIIRWPDRGDLLVVAGIIITLVSLPLALRQVSWGGLVHAMSGTQALPWVPLGVIAYLSAMLLRGGRLRLLVSHESSLTLLAASNVVAVGYAVNNLLPGRIGELVRAHALTQRSGMSFAQAAAVTVLERVLDGLVMLSLFAATATTVSSEFVESKLILGLVNGLAIALFLVFSSTILVAVLSPHNFTKAVAGAAGALNVKWHEPAYVFALQVASGVAYLRSPSGAAKVAALSLATWLVESLMFLCIFAAFGLPTLFSHSLLTMTVTNLGIALPSTPGFIGAWYFFCGETLRLFGVESSTALSYAIVTHLSFYIPITLWGLGVLLAWGIGWGRLLRMKSIVSPARDLETRPGEVPAFAILPPSREHKSMDRAEKFYGALLDAILPAADLHLDEVRIEASRKYVFNFVQGQLKRLPNRLFILFNIGIFGFRMLTWLRYFRAFETLPPDKRDRWIALWADGPVSLTRKLFRPLRSLALLAFFEFTPIQEALDAAAHVPGRGGNIQ